MKGPYIPIYGCGAVFILVATLPLQDSPIGVYFAGMLSATLLEYFTGVAMEAIFQVRYWDYSKEKFNLNGHICLKCSLAWGAMSLLMVYIIHEPIEYIVTTASANINSLCALCFTCVFCADFGYSFKTAFDLRTMILNNRRIMKELLIAQIRLEALEAGIQEKSKETAEKFADVSALATQRFAEYKKNGTLNLESLSEQLKQRVERLNELTDDLKENYSREKISAEIAEARLKVRLATEKRTLEFTDSIQSLIRRNPSAVSRKYSGAIEEFRTQIKQLSTPRRIENMIGKLRDKRKN
jgi:uncharacterized membrane protein